MTTLAAVPENIAAAQAQAVRKTRHAPSSGGKRAKVAGAAASHLVQEWADVMRNYAPSSNRSSNVLTKYERAKIIGVRIEQLARGAAAFVPIDPAAFDVQEVAERELRTGRLPFVVARKMPDGSQELWRLRDMIVV
jgi:DNA-directed RNA polymerase subunit K/omega